MNEPSEQPSKDQPSEGSFDYTYVSSIARIALYDDLRSAPRITEIQPAPTADYIEALASKVYEQAKLAGGAIPYTAIREVSENFIHARFEEIIVSILDEGNTIRFADQGPGISDKEKAQLPGFTSAIEPMKHYIRGVGSGLPIVKEYLDFSHGTITIDDNLGTGAVVTISLRPKDEQEEAPKQPTRGRTRGIIAPPLDDVQRSFLKVLLSEGAVGVTDMSRFTDVIPSTAYNKLKKLEAAGLVEMTAGSKRILTDLGAEVAQSL